MFIQRLKVMVVVLSVVSLFITLARESANQDYTYAVASEKYIEQGRHYEYLTESKVKVDAVTENAVYVIKGNDIYSFWHDGETEIEVGETIICVFNEEMEIIDVK